MKALILKFLTLFFLAWSISGHAANEVRLLRVISASAVSIGRIEVLVANIAYQKKVEIHLQQSGSTWTDFPLTYNRQADSGREIWSADFNPNAITVAPNLRFAIKYTVNNQTYWDNNNGANYVIGKNAGSYLAGVNVLVGNPQAHVDISGTTLNGFVTLRNIAFAKDVKVYYTTNGWATTQIANATYFVGNFWPGVANPNPLNFEEWVFSLNVGNVTAPNPAKTVEYAIRYVIAGQTYWDNNFGFNYRTVVY